MILIFKLFIKEEKLLFFITNLRAFCIHFLQILSSESAGNTLRFKGKFQYIFQTKFFPLDFEGISNNSVRRCIIKFKWNAFNNFCWTHFWQCVHKFCFELWSQILDQVICYPCNYQHIHIFIFRWYYGAIKISIFGTKSLFSWKFNFEILLLFLRECTMIFR